MARACASRQQSAHSPDRLVACALARWPVAAVSEVVAGRGKDLFFRLTAEGCCVCALLWCCAYARLPLVCSSVYPVVLQVQPCLSTSAQARWKRLQGRARPVLLHPRGCRVGEDAERSGQGGGRGSQLLHHPPRSAGVASRLEQRPPPVFCGKACGAACRMSRVT